MEGRHPLDIDDLIVGVLANLQMSTGDVSAQMRDLALLGELYGTLVVDPKRGRRTFDSTGGSCRALRR